MRMGPRYEEEGEWDQDTACEAACCEKTCNHGNHDVSLLGSREGGWARSSRLLQTLQSLVSGRCGLV